MLLEGAAQFGRARILDRDGPRLAATLYQRKDRHRAAIPLFVPVRLVGAVELPSAATALFVQKGFVGFYRLAFAAERAVIVLVHALADAVLQEPGRLVIDVEVPVQ